MEWVGWIVGVGGVDCGSGWSGLWEWVGWIVVVGGVDCGSRWGGLWEWVGGGGWIVRVGGKPFGHQGPVPQNLE